MKTLGRKMTLFAMVIMTCRFVEAQSQLLNDFTSSDWKLIKSSKLKLEDLQGGIIPEVIKLLDRDDKVNVVNTGSLIYPGAEKFYGHGQILDYDIDYISIRAGWLLEEIAFQNFGFTGIHLPESDLVNHIKITFPNYYNNSSNRKKIDSASGAELRSIAQSLSIKSAKEWWANNKSNFSRLEALVSSLKSFDEKRQVKALFYLRNGTTACKDLTKEVYYEEISKEIVRLSGSDVQRIAEHAKLILLDSKLEWLSMKEK